MRDAASQTPSLGELARTAAQLPEPANLFRGRVANDLCIPDNVILFKRRRTSEFLHNTFEFLPHHRYVLISNYGTTGKIVINGIEREFRPGHALAIFPYQFHTFAYFAKEALDWLFVTFETANHATMESLRNRLVPIGNRHTQRLKRLIESYNSGLSEPSKRDLIFNCASFIESLKDQAQAIAPDEGRNAIPVEQSEADNFMLRIQKVIINSEDSLISIDQIASALKVSESYLRATFRKQFGVSLGGYLKNFRIHQAILLMQDPSLNITQIANDLGFTTLPAFSRFFTNMIGESPKSYRSRFLSDNPQ